MFRRAYSMRLLGVLAICLAAVAARAQQGQRPLEPPNRTSAAATSATDKETDLETGESVAVLGKKLWFEVRRRLNLTTEEEERQQKATEKRVKLSLGGLKVSTPATVPKEEQGRSTP